MRASGGHYDARRPGGKTGFTVLGAIGELERSLILERVKEGSGMPREGKAACTPQSNCGRLQDCHPSQPGGVLGNDLRRNRTLQGSSRARLPQLAQK